MQSLVLGSCGLSLGSARSDPSKIGNSKNGDTIMYQNKVNLIGFLGNDAEVRTANDRSFTTFSLATKSSYKDKKSGEYVSHTEWHRCVVFSRLSEFAGTLTKGTHVQVEGELRSREYVGKKAAGKSNKAEETTQRIWEIRVASILKLDRAEKSASEEQEQDDSVPEEVAF
jgi:single-strand DNA-binding protein